MTTAAIPVLDSHKLSSVDRGIQSPFKVFIKSNGISIEFICSELLRTLPGKRLVGAGQYLGTPVVVKFFLHPQKTSKHCSRELIGLDALKRSGIRTPQLLFKGKVEPEDLRVLCFEKIDPDLNYEKIWNEKNQFNNREENLRTLISIVARCHINGIKQDDLHLGNYLSQGEIIYTIDGANIDTHYLGRPLSLKKSIKNLSLFFAQILPCYDVYIKAAFEEYMRIRGWSSENRIYNDLIHNIYQQRHYRKKKYLKKIYRESSEFTCSKSWNHYNVVSRKYVFKGMTRLLVDPDSAMAGGIMLKDGGASTVALVKVDGKQMVVKRYNRKSMKNFLKRCIRNSRAHVSWRNSHMLSMFGIKTNIPVAMIEKRWGIFRLEAYFISEYEEGVNAYDLLHSESNRDFETDKLIDQFIELIKNLTTFSISHGDFKGTNFIVTKKGLNVIDLDAMREHRWKWKFDRAYQKDIRRLLKNWDDLPKIRNLFVEKLKQARLY